jgi:hypothetical protein
MDGKPTGCIEVVIPYDGYKFFKPDAIKDVVKRLGRGRSDTKIETSSMDATTDGSVRTDESAIIGHLVLTNIREAKKADGTPFAPLHGAIPLRVPVRSLELRDENDLASDCMESALQIEYEPSDVDDYPVPVKVEVELFDPADVEILPDEFRAKPGKKKAAAVSNKIVRQAAFSSELLLTMRIRLLWPRRSQNKPTARIRRVSLEWPTITSLSPSSLRFSLGKQAVDVQYNPQAGSLC